MKTTDLNNLLNKSKIVNHKCENSKCASTNAQMYDDISHGIRYYRCTYCWERAVMVIPNE